MRVQARPVSGDDDEAGPFGAEHLEGRDVADADADAGVGDLDLLRGVGDDFVGDHHVVASVSVGDEVVVGVLEEGGDGSRLGTG